CAIGLEIAGLLAATKRIRASRACGRHGSGSNVKRGPAAPGLESAKSGEPDTTGWPSHEVVWQQRRRAENSKQIHMDTNLPALRWSMRQLLLPISLSVLVLIHAGAFAAEEGVAERTKAAAADVKESVQDAGRSVADKAADLWK